MARNDQEPRPSLSRRAFLQRVGSQFGAIGLAACGIGPSAPAPAPPQQSTPARPNILMIMVDALRSDHVASYGYQRPTTPNLDALITSQGTRFQTAFSAAPWTFPSNAAILSGQLPTRLGASWSARPVPTSAAFLQEYLGDAGYFTAGFVTAPFLQQNFGLSQGFSHYDDSLAKRPTSNKGRAEELNGLATRWIQETWRPSIQGKQPAFLYLYYFEPHTFYNAPPPYNTLYDPAYDGPFTPEVYANAEKVISGEMVPTARDIEHLIALYDGEITYWDAQLGQLMGFLQEQGFLDNTLVIVTADHGEMFGEHGKWAHGSSLYDEVLRVPLLMRYPGTIAPGLVIHELVQTMDLTPTILDFAGVAIPGGLDSISLRAGIQGGGLPPRDFLSVVDGLTQPENPAYPYAPRHTFHALRRNEWKLIAQLEGGAPDELYMPGLLSLYEQENFAASHPDIVQGLRQTIQERFFPHTAYLPTVQRS